MPFARIRELIGRRVYYRVTITGFGFFVALAATGAVAMFSGNNLLFLIFSAMLALLLMSGFLSRLVLAGLEIELLLPRHVAARMPMPARIRIRNLKRFTPSFSIELSGSTLSAPLYFPLIPGHQTVEAAVQVIFPRRGEHRDNLFVISTGFPFGFFDKTTEVPLVRETIVYPPIEPAAEAEESWESMVAAISAEAESRVRSTGGDFYRIRPYEHEDSARHVDWKSTAHTGVLQVREFARDRFPTVEVVFDRSIAPGEEERFETLVEQCAYVCWRLTEKDLSFAFRSRGFTCAVPGEGEIYDILKYLALVQPDQNQAEELQENESTLRILFSVSSTA